MYVMLRNNIQIIQSMMYIDHIYTTRHILVRSWRWMNASSLLLPDGSMDVVIEKGTLDSLQDVAFGELWGVLMGKP